MATLPTELRNKLERTCIAARNLAEKAARAALEAVAVQHHEAYGHMTKPQKDLRNKLRAHARQLGDVQDAKGQLSIDHLAQECAYEHWHRMLFARFLAENGLLIEPEMDTAISLDDCKELAKAEKTNLWALAGRYAQRMLPEVFRPDDPVLQVPLAREDQLKLEELLDDLPREVFAASDSLGWCYQFWQTQRKDQVNDSGEKIGADELPAVTQLFTEDYMVDFLLDNTMGAWWAGRLAAANSARFTVASCPTEAEVRKRCALPGCPWRYLRFVVREMDGAEVWTPAAGTFDGWPKTAKELKCLDPCMGSGHFVVAMFERLVALRMADEKQEEKVAVAAAIRDNLFGLEIDPRCTQIGAFNLALAAWRRVGHKPLPSMHLACSGLAPNARREDWVRLAEGNANLRFAMGALYDLFQKAPVLGSLVDPRRDKAVTYASTVQELQPLLAAAMVKERPDDVHELAVAAQGIAKAVEILGRQFALVATNVPYLGAKKQDDVLRDFCQRVHPDAKADLATCFVERCVGFCGPHGAIAVVTPQNWLFLSAFSEFREHLLERFQWHVVVRMGEHAFDSPAAAGAFAAMAILSKCEPSAHQEVATIDVSALRGQPPIYAEQKARLLLGDSGKEAVFVPQAGQLKNPDARIVFSVVAGGPLLEELVDSAQGIKTGDDEKWRRTFWEFPRLAEGWKWYQTSVVKDQPYGGASLVIDWRTGGQGMVRPRLGNPVQSRLGVAISPMGPLPAALYLGERFESSIAPLVPRNAKHLLPLWAFVSSEEYKKAVRAIDQKLCVTTDTLAKVSFDLAHWQKVSARKYPLGLPKPFSADPTQWLFTGYPQESEIPLQVGVARLLGYEWPRQTGSSFPDCAALRPDGLEKFADDDGIVCIPSVRGEEPAADRLRKLLAAAYGKDWKSGTELELIRASDSEAGDLEEWLRNDFFWQHNELFEQRPFVWHIWDGRKRDGFHALVNYHRLAAGSKGRKTLESLTFAYLGEWIARQKDGEKRGEAGAEERLAAALELKARLEAIIEGDPPFDVFVRWKGLADQAIGWEPDISDGVRMNIRPFMVKDLPNGKAGAGILRWKPNIKWDKDRGREPVRPKGEFPWFWNGGEFTGDRVNDVHLTIEQKRKARKE
jgi:hypothetical protein